MENTSEELKKVSAKDKTIEIFSKLGHVPKEVAIKIVEQFPHFSKAGEKAINDIKDVAEKDIERSMEDSSEVSDICSEVIEACQECLKDENMTPEHKLEIIDKMKDVYERKIEQAKEANIHAENVLKMAGGVALGVTALLAGALGGNIKLPSNKK